MKRELIKAAALGIVLWLSAFAFLFWVDWRVGIGVFLGLWAQNQDRQVDKIRRDIIFHRLFEGEKK